MPDESTELKIRATTTQIWKVSLPIIFAGISESVVDVTDAIFLGRYGVTELGRAVLRAEAERQAALLEMARALDLGGSV